MWNIFEQPWTLLGAAILVLLGVLIFRSIRYEKRRSWQWLLPAGVALLAVGLDLGVTTDREKIQQVLKAGVKAIEKEDCVALARLIADDYQDSAHKSKESLLGQCRARLAPPAVQKIHKFRVEPEVAPPSAKATVALWITFDKDSFWAQAYKPTALVTVQVHFRKQANGTWLVSRVEVLEVDKMPASWNMAQAPGTERETMGRVAAERLRITERPLVNHADVRPAVNWDATVAVAARTFSSSAR